MMNFRWFSQFLSDVGQQDVSSTQFTGFWLVNDVTAGQTAPWSSGGQQFRGVSQANSVQAERG